MLTVKHDGRYECSEEVVYLDRSRLYLDYKDCEAHRCVDFLQVSFLLLCGS